MAKAEEQKVFGLWHDAPKGPLSMFAKRNEDEVKTEYHDMPIGEFRELGDDMLIQRIA